MANAVRMRVELRPSANKTRDEQFREMLHVFKRRCNECGILSKFKDYEFFESKSQKNRKKKRESELRRKKEKDEQVSRGRRGKSFYKKADESNEY